MTSKPLVYGSHPDIHRIHYPDVTRHTASVNRGIGNTDDYKYGLKFLGHNNYTPFALNPNVQTDMKPQLHYLNVFKPPPPYPSNGLASNSTPDLALASQALNYHRGYINAHVTGSSPDLVSTRNALSRQYLGFINENPHNVINYNRAVLPATHGTYNNLTSVLDVANPHIIMDPRRISDSVPKIHDERTNIMYNVHRVPYQRHVVLPQQQMTNLANPDEPIYENIPLPWQNSKHQIRNRAQSLTTTEEITRLNERNSSHPSIPMINNYDRIPNQNAPTYPHVPPSIQITDDNSHYVNAQVIKGVRESSIPKDLSASNKSINKESEFDNINLSVDRLSLTRDDKTDYADETPYQSLSTHRLNNNFDKSNDNITSINVPDIKSIDRFNSNVSHSSYNDSGVTNSSIINTTYSTSIDLESSANTTKNTSVSSKEKKRRRWGVFMGRGNKNVDVKSATLGRDRNKNSTNTTHLANKHRWSTGLPKFQPLPPSITKETLVSKFDNQISVFQFRKQ